MTSFSSSIPYFASHPCQSNILLASLCTRQLIQRPFSLGLVEIRPRKLRTQFVTAELQPPRLGAARVVQSNSKIMDDKAFWSQPFHQVLLMQSEEGGVAHPPSHPLSQTLTHSGRFLLAVLSSSFIFAFTLLAFYW